MPSHVERSQTRRSTVLLTGATGFIGRRLRARLLQRGHVVIGTRRRPIDDEDDDGTRWRRLDFVDATEPADWLPVLRGVDVAVNAAGVFAQAAGGRMQAIHRDAPTALFSACVLAGVTRVVQLSALSSPAAADCAFIASKHAADAQLLALPLDAVVVRPSLVFGTDGASSRLLMTLASLPLLLLPRLDSRGDVPGGGTVQPVHVDDLVQALARLVELDHAPPARCIAVVGPHPLPLVDYLRTLRRGLGMGAGLVLQFPLGWARAAAGLGGRHSPAWLNRDSLRLLQAGSRADVAQTRALLGRSPRPAEVFVEARDRDDLRHRAVLGWALPLLRGAIASVWIVTAIVSAVVFPVRESYALLAAVGVPPALQPATLWGAVALDAALGLLTLLAPGRWLWRSQIGLVLLYTALITWRLPEYWMHPFGPLLKNLPMLAALLLLDALESPRGRRRWNT